MTAGNTFWRSSNHLRMKKCSRCKEMKAASEYYRNKRAKDGLNGHCKACHALKVKEYRQRHPDRRKAHKKKWRAENPEKVNAMQRRAGKNDAANLTDGYVRKKIVQGVEGLAAGDIPDILVQLKRNEIKIDRLIKIKKHEINQQNIRRDLPSEND